MKIKKRKAQKYTIKIKLKFEDYKNCLDAPQIEKKINHLKKNHIDSPKEFTRNNKLRLKTQQRFKSERYNVFAEEINKVALSSDDDKRIQSFDAIETYAYGMKKDLV